MTSTAQTRRAEAQHARAFDAFQLFLQSLCLPAYMGGADAVQVAADWHRKAVRS